MRIRENLGMIGSSLELILMFGALIFVCTIAFRVALDAVNELEATIAKLF